MQKSKKIGNAQQMLLDIATAASKSAALTPAQKQALLAQITDLTKALSDNILDDANKIFDARNYRNVSFTMVPTIKECSSLAELCVLPPKELQLLVFFERIATTQYVRISHAQISEILEMSLATVKRTMKSLLSKHIIEIAVEATNRQPAIYRINSIVLRTGKTKTQTLEKDAFIKANGKSEIQELFSTKYDLETASYTKNDGSVFLYTVPELK